MGQCRTLHEIEHRETRGEARGAGGGQDVVGAANVIADGLGRPLTQKYRTCVGDLGAERVGIGDAKFEVFGGDAVGELGRHVKVWHSDDRAEIAP